MKVLNNPNIGTMTKTTKTEVKNDTDFDQKLNEKRSANDQTVKLKNLLERIDAQSQKLSSRMNLDELITYKKLISEFLNLAVDVTYKFTKERFLDSRGRHRVYAGVKVVNQEIDKLTTEILKKQQNKINILAGIDDIRGMLINLVM